MSRLLQLSDGRFVLGQQTFSEAELVDRYRRGAAVLVRDDRGVLRVLRRWSDALGLRLVEVLAHGQDCDRALLCECRLRVEVEQNGDGGRQVVVGPWGGVAMNETTQRGSDNGKH